MRNRDPLGYYAALNISPEATVVEIRLAYQFLKDSYQEKRKQHDIGKIRAAYATLRDPRSRRRYDRGETGSRARVDLRKYVTARRVLSVLLVVAAVVLLWQVGPSLRAQLRSFGPGDEIFWVETGLPAGMVMSYDAEHRFPSGAVAPAYEVRPDTGGSPVWYPARDVKRYCRTR